MATPTTIQSLPPPPNTQSIDRVEVVRATDSSGKPIHIQLSTSTDPTWQDWLWRLRQALNTAPIATGTQVAIQFQDEGSNLGTSGTVTTFNVVGPDVVASRSVDTITLTQSRPTITLTGDVTGSGTTSITTAYNGVVPVNKGGTNITSYTIGDLLYASGTTTLSKLADVAAGSYLRSGGVGVAPVWSTTTLPNSSTTGDLLYASAANTYSNLADVATGNALISGGVGVAPSWGKVSLTTTVSGTLQAAQFPALTGDVTTSAGSLATTLATVNASPGTYGSATQVPVFVVNGKGLVTSVTNTTISGVVPGGVAGGDLAGTYPNPTVYQAHLTDQAVPSAPASGTLILYSFNQQGFSVPHVQDPQGNAIELTRDNILVARNTTGSSITRGSAVYVNGATGTVPTIALAKADSLTTLPALGIMYDTTANNAFGRVMLLGDLENINLSSFSNGDLLYVSAASAGVLTNVAPSSPNYRQQIGTVINNGVGNGVLQVRTYSVDNAPLANPTATIGLTAVNGTATTAMRSDAAPALSQSITPTWTGLHTHTQNATTVARENTTTTILNVGNDASAVGTEQKSFAGVNFQRFYRAQGTAASPTSSTAVSAYQLQINGYTGSAYAVGASIQAVFTETWGASAHGTRWNFSGTVTGASSTSSWLQLIDGSVVCGTTNRISTSATNGYLYVPTAGGFPTGVPAAQGNLSTMAYDDNDDAICFYNQGFGYWKYWLYNQALYKTSNQSITSSTTLTNCTDLAFPIAPLNRYAVDFTIDAGAALATTGFKVACTTTTATIGVFEMQVSYIPDKFDTTGTSVQVKRTSTSGATIDFTPADCTAAGDAMISIKLFISTTGGSAIGITALQFAQSTSSGTALTFRAGSFLKLSQTGN